MRGQRSSVVAHLGLATLSLVLFLTFLDNTVVSATLANIQGSLHAGVAGLQWVVNSYALVFASFMLAAGSLGDLFGRKRIMLAGVAVFCAGSVLAALAPNIDVLDRRPGGDGARGGRLRAGDALDDPPHLPRAPGPRPGAWDLGGRLRAGARDGTGRRAGPSSGCGRGGRSSGSTCSSG